jgi:hypothetical protein
VKKIIARIRGGLGNQLFCYAAARRLAIANDAELVIDHITGFVRDREYQRKYMLDRFHIPARTASRAELLQPFERYRRGLLKIVSRKRSFAERKYIEEERQEFDDRLLTLKVDGTLYLDGLWQSAAYFEDVERVIREDLRFIPPGDLVNRQAEEAIRKSEAVALHVRWHNAPTSSRIGNAPREYYQRAIALLESEIASAHYFLFSDQPMFAREIVNLPDNRVTTISHNVGDAAAHLDMWLMTLCKHFITANSTYSWWGAWLAETEKRKMVITPGTFRAMRADSPMVSTDSNLR